MGKPCTLMGACAASSYPFYTKPPFQITMSYTTTTLTASDFIDKMMSGVTEIINDTSGKVQASLLRNFGLNQLNKN